MGTEAFIFSIFMIFLCAALLSTFALQTRQSLLVAYIAVGMILGPWGIGLVSDNSVIHEAGDVGIVFLLFLLGLHLDPQNLWHMLRKVTVLTIISSLLFLGLGMSVAWLFGYAFQDAFLIGTAFMFSSTIIGLKLLPTTILHHQHTGEVMISVLLMQDLVAIVVLLLLSAMAKGDLDIQGMALISLSLPVLLLVAFVMERFVLVKLIARFERVREYIFLLAIAWCLGMAELAELMRLSHEVGAFIAGVALAASPIANYIAESLKPLRDFFLVIFFFSIGAGFDFGYLPAVVLPAGLLAIICMTAKPVIFRWLLGEVGETRQVAWEVGIRLAQTSEFSLLVGYLAYNLTLISTKANSIIQATTIMTFIVSSYLVVLRYPTPLALNPRMQKD